MSHRPYERNVSGIFYLGDPGSDAMMKTTSDIIISDGGGSSSYIQSANFVVANGGSIGSVTDKDAITIASNGDVTFSQSVSITDDLTVGGTLFTLDTESLVISDPLIHLGSGNAADINDLGFFGEFNDGGTKYCGIFRDASSDKFRLFTGLEEKPGTTVDTGDSTYTVSTLVANLEGNADSATELETSRTFQVTGMGTSPVPAPFDGTSNVAIPFVLDKSAITGQTNMTAIDNSDMFLVWDQNINALRKVSRSVIVAGLGAGSMESFSVSDGVNTKSIDDGDTVFYESDGTIDWTVGNGSTSTAIVSGVVKTNSIDETHLKSTIATEGVQGGNGTKLKLDFNGLTLQNIIGTNTIAFYSGADTAHRKVRFSQFNTTLDHDVLDNYVADEHIDHTTVTMTAGTGIAGGGTIADNRTFNLDLNSLAGVNIASTDSIAIVDSSDSSNSKKALWSSVVTTLAGEGLTAAGASIDLDIGALGAANPGNAIASGDQFAGYDGSDSVTWNTSQLGNWLAGTNISVDGQGKLSVANQVTPYDFETDDTGAFTLSFGDSLKLLGGTGLVTSDNQSDTIEIDLAFGELSALTSLAIGDSLVFADVSDSNEAKKITYANFSSSLAGDGLTTDVAGGLEVNTGAGLETNGDAVRISTAAAGAGLGGGGGSALSVNVSTGLEISSDSVRISAAAAGNGLTGGAGNALAVGAGSLIDVTANAVNVDLTEAASANIANGDYLIFLDGGATGAESKGSTSSLATMLAGNGLSVSLATSELSLNFADLSAVAIASGDSFITLDSNGQTEQRSTITDVGTYFAGNGLTATSDGKLNVTSDALGSISTENITASDSMVYIDAGDGTAKKSGLTALADILTDASNSALRNDGADILVDIDNTVSATPQGADKFLFEDGAVSDLHQHATLATLATEMAGSALSVTSGLTIDVNVDDTTIEVALGGNLAVKNDSITERKRVRTVDADVATNKTASADFTSVDAAGGDVTITLPNNGGTSGTGRLMTVKKVDSSSNKVTIQRAGSNLIDGASTLILYNQNETMTFIFAGDNNWYLM